MASPPGNIMASASPPEAGFVPRKEFLRDQRVTANTFALMTISGSNLIRLYSFPIVVIKALRIMFEHRKLMSFVREDTTQNCCEFAMEGKPWTMPKNVYTEKLLLDVLAVLAQHGWNFLSTIDYGREHDDRLALTFSKSCIIQQPTRGSSPAPTTPNASGSNLHERQGTRRTFFGVSFASAALLRVISPPLNITPAILQAVRGAWPRGVVSEKKIGASAFEFKLKGYKWFQEDTFATDSLRHILTLLTSLDIYDFSLITSLSLSNRSRVKDLWIFAGPPSSSDEIQLPDSPLSSILNNSQPDLKRLVHLQDISHSPPFHTQFQHRRFASSPVNTPPPPQSPHVRAATEGSINYAATPDTQFTGRLSTNEVDPSSSLNRRSISRKPAPRAQVPVSALYDGEAPAQLREYHRANLPSTISNGTPDMTGIGSRGGSPELFHPAPAWIGGHGTSPPGSPEAVAEATLPSPSQTSPSRPPRAKTPPLLVSNGNTPYSTPPITHVIHPTETTNRSTPSLTPALLSPGIFRDSAFSSSEASYDIPIKWTGPASPAAETRDHLRPGSPKRDQVPSATMFPGGWRPTPVEEKNEEDVRFPHPQSHSPTSSHMFPHQHYAPSLERQVQEVRSLVESPEFKQGDHRSRKSEAGVVGLIADPPALPPTPPVPKLPNKGKGKETGAHASSSSGQGWVLVNVDRDAQNQKSPRTDASVQHLGGVHRTSESRSRSSLQYTTAPDSPLSRGMAEFPRKGPPEQSPTPPTAKAIVAIDAVEAKSKTKSGEESSSAVRRLLSLTRRNSNKKHTDESDERLVDRTKEIEATAHIIEAATKTKTRTRGVLRSKFKFMGTPESSRNNDRRRSMDGF